MQNIVKEFNEHMTCHKKRMPESARVLAILSECGELAKEILKSSKYTDESFILTEEFEIEYGDILYNLLCLGNETNLDAKECLNKALDKYKKRQSEKNNLSSN